MDAVGRLAGGVAHDFNNLLTIIGGYGRMVLDHLSAGDHARGSMEQVLNAAERAAVLTSQLLAFSRRQAAQPKVIELNHVISNLEKMLRRVIGEHIELRTVFDPALPRVKADAGQVEQVLMNLAINARDAMPQGGTLTIESRGVYRRGVPHVRLSVMDTGVGMDAATRGRLFEPFFTTKGRGKGTGLGLSTVYGIVKQHAGDIAVESEPGGGARFHIHLPAVEGEAEPAAAQEVASAPGRGSETILLVEDDAGVRRVARDTLGGHGYRVLEAAGGQEALGIAEAEAGRIHLLVTDMIMPLMSGRELARRLIERDGSLRVIYMSGYTDDVIAYHGELGRDADFLRKPFAPEALARKVRAVLDGGKGVAGVSKRSRH
jgi:CheY-like chemotaxis protein